MNLIVTTYPFGQKDIIPKTELENFSKKTGINIYYNSVGRKYTKEEHLDQIVKKNPTFIVAGTELYNKEIFSLCSNLKIISRVGIGLDSIDLKIAKNNNIVVCNTPDAPSNAVAELVICQIINMLRKVKVCSDNFKTWNRFVGREIKNCSIGIIGFGRIGKSLFKKLLSFECENIYINDINRHQLLNVDQRLIKSKEFILKNCDIASIHIPGDKENLNFITLKDLYSMKQNACLLNFSRGGIINEKHLVKFLRKNENFSVAIDTFNEEPYFGELIELKNCYLTPHLGSCSEKSRIGMELGAVKEIIRFYEGKSLVNRIV